MNAEQKAALEEVIGKLAGLPHEQRNRVLLQSLLAELEAQETVKVPGWQPIKTAPKETEILVGRCINGEWRICQSGLYYDGGMNNSNGYEPPCWFWCCDWDAGGVTENEGPTHWMPLPAAPQAEPEPLKVPEKSDE